MFGRLLKARRAKPPRAMPVVPPGMRVYAIGDIHGRVDLLRTLHGRIAEDAASAAGRKVIVYLGDFIDRGEQSREVLDLLLDEPVPACEAVHLCGNHEQSLLLFLNDLSIGPDWLAFGGSLTLRSYGIAVPPGGLDRATLQALQTALRERLPERHLAFLRQLKFQHSEGDYLFVHAGVRPGIPLERQDFQDLMWIREPFLSSAADLGKVVVHGHSIVDQVSFHDNRIAIDTGAYYSGRLSCLVLEGGGRRVIGT